MEIPVGFRGTDKVGLLVATQVAQSRGATMQNEVLVPNQKSSLTAVCVVAVEGKFVIVPIDQLVPLIDITVKPGPTDKAEASEESAE